MTGRQIEKSKGLDPVENLRQIPLLKWALISSAEYRNPALLIHRWIPKRSFLGHSSHRINKALLEQDTKMSKKEKAGLHRKNNKLTPC